MGSRCKFETPWKEIPSDHRTGFLSQLRIETDSDHHPLSGVDVIPVAHRVDQDTVLFRFRNQPERHAQVFLCWTPGPPSISGLPHVEFFDSFDDWADCVMAIDAAKPEEGRVFTRLPAIPYSAKNADEPLQPMSEQIIMWIGITFVLGGMWGVASFVGFSLALLVPLIVLVGLGVPLRLLNRREVVYAVLGPRNATFFLANGTVSSFKFRSTKVKWTPALSILTGRLLKLIDTKSGNWVSFSAGFPGLRKLSSQFTHVQSDEPRSR